MTITLPDEMRADLELAAKAAGFASVDEYVADVLRLEGEAIEVPPPHAGRRYAVNSRAELEAKLLEGMDTAGDVVAGPDFWERRREAAERRAAGPRP